MKITFVLPYAGLSGGVRVVAIYAERLRKRGHEVYIVSTHKYRPTKRQQLVDFLLRRELDEELEPSHLDQIDVPHYVVRPGRIVTDADVPDADVVIATWWETAEWVAKLSERKGEKAYFVQHHEVFDYLPQDRTKATYKLPFHKITISQWLSDIMEREYGDSHVSLVPNGVDLLQFDVPPRNKQTLPTVGLLYNSLYWKGCDISFKAFELAAQKIPNLQLIAFGDSEPIPELPLPPGTRYIRQPDQGTLKEIYGQCDMWLFGSRLEGFGLPILEAMACRTPVIGTPAGAAPELIAKGGGLLVNPNDPADMARAIEQVCSLSNEQWQVLSDDAYTTATQHTWDTATDRFEAVLQTLIDRKKNHTYSPLPRFRTGQLQVQT